MIYIVRMGFTCRGTYVNSGTIVVLVCEGRDAEGYRHTFTVLTEDGLLLTKTRPNALSRDDYLRRP